MIEKSVDRILYIEDDESQAALFCLSLEARGYSVTVAKTGEDGLAMHAASTYELIAIDYLLPGINGLEVAQTILDGDPDFPIVIVTGEGNEEIAARALRLGVYNYVIKKSKNTYFEILPETITSALKRSTERRDKIKSDLALKVSEKRYREIADVSSDWVWEMDSDLRISHLSEGFKRLTGIDAQFSIGRTRQETSPPEALEKPHWQQHVRDLEARREFRNFQYDFMGPDGNKRYFRVSGSPIIDDQGAFKGYRGTCSDITEYIKTHEALRKSEEEKRLILDAAGEGVYGLDLDGNTTFVNAAGCKILGYRKSELIGRPMHSVVHHTHADGTPYKVENCPMYAAFTDGAVHTVMDEVLWRKDGSSFPVEYTSTPIRKDGKLTGAVIVFRDIHERKHTERLLRNEIQLRQGLLDTTQEGYWQIDNAGITLNVNPALCHILGRKRNEIVGKTIFDFVDSENTKILKQEISERKKGKAGAYEIALQRPDGTKVPCINNATPIYNEDAIQIGSVGMWTDITELRQTELALKKSNIDLEASRLEVQGRYDAIVDASPSAMALHDSNHRFIVVNKAFGEWMSCDPSELAGKRMRDVFPQNEADEIKAINQKVIETGKPINIETTRTFQDGRVRNVLIHKSALLGASGKVSTVSTILTDITKMKNAEAAAHENENRFRSVIDNLIIGVCLKDKDGKVLLANHQILKWWGIAEEEALGKTTDEISGDPEDVCRVRSKQEREVWDSQEVRTRHQENKLRSDGSLRHIIITKIPIFGKDGKVVALCNMVQDVTDIKNAEKFAQASETRLKEILDIAPEAVITVGADMNIQLFNQGAERIFGYDSSDVVGRSIEFLMPEKFRKNHQDHVDGFNHSGGVYRLMDLRQGILGLRKDGTEFPASASISKLESGGEKMYTVVLQDITERNRAQEALVNAKGEAETASQAKSQFLAGMSHELRTPLNAIIGFSQILHGEYFGPLGDEKYKEYVGDINSSGEHLLALVDDLLDISTIEAGKQSLVKEKLITNEIVGECLKLVSTKAQIGNINLKADVPEDLPSLYADYRAIKQILINLLSNAIKFTPKGGKISVSAKADKESTTIYVTDTGIGIPADILPKLTEMFVRAEHDAYVAEKGWGLGLSITKSLVDLHEGMLGIESEVGKGTIVTVRFPSASP